MNGNHKIRSQNKQLTTTFSYIFKYLSYKSRPTTRNHGSSIWDPGNLPGNSSFSTSENINLYNKVIVGIPESDRYDLTRYKWTEFYQELEDAVSTF